MVTIEVGAAKEHFVVHQSFLCAKSQYFVKALSGSFQEAITRFVRLPDVSPILFRIFVTWLYHGILVYFPHDNATIDKDFDSLKITEKDLESKIIHQSEIHHKDGESNNDNSSDLNTDNTIAGPASEIVTSEDRGHDTSSTLNSSDIASSTEESKYREDDSATWPYSVFVKLYILADRFDVRGLRADSLDALLNLLDVQNATFDSTDIHYIFQNTSAAAKLRRMVIDSTVYRHYFHSDPSQYEELPKEFLAAVMVASSRRLPSQLCKKCHKEALGECDSDDSDDSDSSYDSDDSAGEDEGDIAPYKKDCCLYHEHPDEEEREACRSSRKGSKSAT